MSSLSCSLLKEKYTDVTAYKKCAVKTKFKKIYIFQKKISVFLKIMSEQKKIILSHLFWQAL
jgi:hypothetical protein